MAKPVIQNKEMAKIETKNSYKKEEHLLDPNLSNRSVAFVLGQISLSKKTN